MLKNIIKDLEEVKEALEKHKQAQNLMRKADRKLKSLLNKYSFLETIVGIDVNDNILENAVKLLLKNAGFERVINYRSPRIRVKREDLLAYSVNDLLVIEVRGLNKVNPTKYDVLKVFPYKVENKKRQPNLNVYGLTIINHDNDNPVQNRKSTFKSQENEQDAINCGYGYISTIELVIGFWQLKMNIITFEEFKTRLFQTGSIMFDSNGGKTRRQIGL